MDLSLLGPIEARLAGRLVPLGTTKQRALLALLALRVNTPVSSDRLIEGLWGDRPPPSAHKMVQHYVSQLRRALSAAADGVEILTRGRGYELRLGPDGLDIRRFERLVAEGAPREALALWRGPPLADVADEPFAAAEIRRLEEMRLGAVELAIERDLAAGRHREVVGELDALVAEEPLRERLHAHRMLALYRSGRQAEALEAYRHARRALVEQVGVEPGPELARLQRAILAQDETLQPAPVERERSKRRDISPPERVFELRGGTRTPSHEPGRANPALPRERSGDTLVHADDDADRRAGLPPPPEVIGRERELAALRAFAERLGERPSAVMLVGAAGMGKTTLWRVAVESARARAHQVLVTRPSAAEARLGFAGLRDLIEEVSEVLDHLPGPQADALRIALLLERPGRTAVDQPAVAASLLSALRALSAIRPVLVAVDDIQWLDAPTATALGFAWRRMRAERIGLLLAQRGSEPVAGGLAATEGLERIDVEPLGPDAIHHVLQQRLGLRFPGPMLRRLHSVAGGNPLFALELGPAFDRHRAEISAGAPAPVPERLLDLVADRLAALPASTRDALAAAAALSRPTPALVAAVVGGEDDLRPAFAAKVVGLEKERLQFSHPLLASAAYEALDPVARRRLHRQLADVVPDEDERAHHLALGTAEPDAAVADALERAAVVALRRGASATAAELNEHAGRLTPPGAPGDRQRRTVSAARQHWTAGDITRGRTLLEEAIERAPSSAARAEALSYLGWVYLFHGDQPRAAETARRALAEDGAAFGTRANAENCLAAALRFMGETLDEAARCAARAAELGRRGGDIVTHNDALCEIGLTECLRGTGRGDAYLRAAKDQGEEAGGWRINGWPEKHQARVALWADGHEAAATAFRRLLTCATERGDEASMPDILSNLAYAEYLAGRWPEATRAATAASETALSVGERSHQAAALAIRARIAAATGHESDALADATAALELIGERGTIMARIDSVAALALLDLMHGRPQDAADRLKPLRQRLLAAGVGEPGAMGFMADELEAHVALGQHADAAELNDWLEARGAALDRASALAAAARGQGMLAAARGDHDAALAALTVAVSEYDRAAIPFERARTLLHLGTAQHRAKQTRAARASLSDALRIFETLGAAPWGAQAAGQLARIDGHDP